MYECVSETMFFLTLLLGDPGQSAFTDGVTATAAQTAEVCSCGVPLDRKPQRSHCLDTSLKYNGGRKSVEIQTVTRKGTFKRIIKKTNLQGK